MWALILATALGVAADSAKAPVYDGEWRHVCGDPAVSSDLEFAGPEGTVIGYFAQRKKVVIATGDAGRLTVELAGISAVEGGGQRLSVLAPVGATVGTSFYHAQEGRTRVGRVVHAGRDVGLGLIVSGSASYMPSAELTAYDGCLYEQAETAARRAKVGLWSKPQR